MINQKIKKQNKIQEQYLKNTTLDKIHNLKVDEFDKNEKEIIPKLKEEIEILKVKIRCPTTDIEDKLNFVDEANNLLRKIRSLKRDKKNYYKNNSHHIFTYFEKKKNISSSQPQTSVVSKNNTINKFFNIGEKEDLKIVEKKEDDYIDKYFNNVFKTVYNMDKYAYPRDICDTCNKGEMIHIEEEGQLVCSECYCSIPYLFENEKPSYKEPPKEVCFYAYKRVNHFKEIVAQFQGKETTQISDNIINKIKLQIKKERLTKSQITNEAIKDILKKINYQTKYTENATNIKQKYCEHATFIRSKLGIKPPIISPEIEEKLFTLFGDIQTPYATVCPEHRINFMNYHYTFYKLLERLNQTQYLPLISLLKDRDKIIEQDSTWKGICEILNWTYISTT